MKWNECFYRYLWFLRDKQPTYDQADKSNAQTLSLIDDIYMDRNFGIFCERQVHCSCPEELVLFLVQGFWYTETWASSIIWTINNPYDVDCGESRVKNRGYHTIQSLKKLQKVQDEWQRKVHQDGSCQGQVPSQGREQYCIPFQHEVYQWLQLLPLIGKAGIWFLKLPQSTWSTSSRIYLIMAMT